MIAKGQDQSPLDTSWKHVYRAAATKINDLIHTKLDVRFDFEKSYMYGKAWITLRPHYYPTDSLTLDAKGMEFHKVAIMKGTTPKDLKYTHDDMQIHISLDKTYKGGEPYTIYIDYTSKPNEVKVQGSAAISDAKGLYFINPQGKEKDKPTQIWTQGETEANSVWMPTIDKPNQKSTEEIYMTVPDKFVTLSNGVLIHKKKNKDGTRTDYWRMSLPHAPYLFFMGAGEFSIIKDSYKGKEVSYYVDKSYAPVARKIFGHTPEMIRYFSKITGVDFPWPKYSQITGHDYVSGAMENTTATLHSDAAQQDARELVDGNRWETTIAHELFHHWFGDLVTAESWSNITVNESFADYSETLWQQYKYGKDAGDEQNFMDRTGYLSNPANSKKHLVRFYYSDKEDVFDGVSYQKGGAILHMLRNYVGDSAFFKSLQLYLTTYKFKAAEAQQLRLAFEEVTGRDLNWFWNQWYYGAGNPTLDINYSYDEVAKRVKVIINQTQQNQIFKLPVAIDVYSGGNKARYTIWANEKSDTFSFEALQKPDLVNFDGDKVLLCSKKENKTLDEYIFQYRHAGNFVDRREAIEYASKNQTDPKAVSFLKDALKDKYEGLRIFTLNRLNMKNQPVKEAVEATIADLAKNDPVRTVKAIAISKLSSYKMKEYESIYKNAINDSSYSVSGNALDALFDIDSVAAINEAKRLSLRPAKGKLEYSLTSILINSGDESIVDGLLSNFEKMPLSQNKFNLLQSIVDFASKSTNTVIVKKGVDAIVNFRDAVPELIKGQLNPYINGVLLKGLAEKKKESGLQDQADYILSKLPESKN